MSNETKQAWRRLVGRCLVPSYDGYNGAKICDRWLSYEGFLADLGEKPKGYSLYRMDSSRPFEPGNVAWRDPNHVEFEGIRFTIKEWARRLGLEEGTLWNRISRKGWGLERAFCTAVRRVGLPKGGYESSAWALRIDGEADGIKFENQLSLHYYETFKSALETWRGLVARCREEGFACRVDLVRRCPLDVEWVEVLSFNPGAPRS